MKRTIFFLLGSAAQGAEKVSFLACPLGRYWPKNHLNQWKNVFDMQDL